MNQAISLTFEYSPELEIKRIEYTIGRLDWYLQNKYSLDWITLPSSLDRNKLKSISQDKIKKAISTEYDPNYYSSAIDSIKSSYATYKDRMAKFVNDLGLKIIPEIIVIPTRYGIGGSYHSPNKVILNISRKQSEIDLLGTVLHEIIHLHIQPLIDKHKVGQWEKETLVKLLFESAFPDINKVHQIAIDTTRIEKIYQENFPNIEEIVSQL